MKSWFMDLMFETRIKSVWVKVESLISVFGLLDLLWSPWSSVEAFRCVVFKRWHHNVSKNTCRCGLTDVASVIITQWNQDDHIQFLLTIKFSRSRWASRPELQTCCSSSITRASRVFSVSDRFWGEQFKSPVGNNLFILYNETLQLISLGLLSET